MDSGRHLSGLVAVNPAGREFVGGGHTAIVPISHVFVDYGNSLLHSVSAFRQVWFF